MATGVRSRVVSALIMAFCVNCEAVQLPCAQGDIQCDPVSIVAWNPGVTGITATPTSPCELNAGGKCMYVTSGTFNGEFEVFPGAVSPDTIGGADLFCMSQRPAALVGTYKALIVDGQSDADGRTGTVGSQTNWVLVAGTAYYRFEDNALIQTAIANNTLPFPLNVSFSTLASGRMWTGLATSWTSSASRCIDSGAPSVSWDSGLNAQSGRVGDITSTSNTAIDSGAGDIRTCDTTHHVLCVQQ